MQILPKFNLETIQTVLQTDFPELEIRNIKLLNNGWDNVVADVNGEDIFRFPKNSEVNLDLEIKVLNYIKGKISTQTPEIAFHGRSSDYYGYQKILGVDLTDQLYNSMSEEEKDKLAHDLSNFLRELHQAVTVEDARQLGVNQKMAEWYFENPSELKNKFIDDKKISSFVSKVVDDFERIFKESKDLVFLHNDLHDENIAIDPIAKKLNGVFDFSDISIGDRNFDFTPMCRFCSTDLTKRMVNQYQKMTGIGLDWQKIKTYAYVWEISDVVQYFDRQNNKIFIEGMTRIKKWAEEE